MNNLVVKLFICILPLCRGQESVSVNASTPSLNAGLTEKIGNFSIELLYHTSVLQQLNSENMIMSPITVWTALAAIAEGASGKTLTALHFALRLAKKYRAATRSELHDITQQLQLHSDTIELRKMNTILIDRHRLPLQDFVENTKKFYDTNVYSASFTDTEVISHLINRISSVTTNAEIPNVVESSYFANARMILVSALFFKGQWNMPFNKSLTTRLPFFSSSGERIGEVNMMYSKNTYPLSTIKKLQARVIELPYGNENNFSIFIMLPNPGVTLKDMFFNLKNITLHEVYEELRVCGEVFGDDKVDCYIPRFQIDSNLELSDVLRKRLGLGDLLDENKIRLPGVARTPVHVSKVIHRVKIDVTEAGITSPNTNIEHNNNSYSAGTVIFNANRPFVFLIVEKVTNSILFGGYYQQPSLF